MNPNNKNYKHDESVILFENFEDSQAINYRLYLFY